MSLAAYHNNTYRSCSRKREKGRNIDPEIRHYNDHHSVYPRNRNHHDHRNHVDQNISHSRHNLDRSRFSPLHICCACTRRGRILHVHIRRVDIHHVRSHDHNLVRCLHSFHDHILDHNHTNRTDNSYQNRIKHFPRIHYSRILHIRVYSHILRNKIEVYI